MTQKKQSWIPGTDEAQQLMGLVAMLRESGVARFRLGELELELYQTAPTMQLDDPFEELPTVDADNDGRFDHVGIRLKATTEDEDNAI